MAKPGPKPKYEALYPEILKMFNANYSQVEIAEHLKRKYGLTASIAGLKSTISTFLSEAEKKGKIQRESEAIIVAKADDPSSTKEQIKKLFFKKDTWTVEQIADTVNIGPGKVRAYLSELRDEGFNVKVEADHAVLSKIISKSAPTTIDVARMSTSFFKFGVCGDNHLGSYYERLDVLNALYDIYEQEGISVVFNTGNWIDGEARFNKHDLHTHGMDRQLDYFIKHYPQRKGITTHFIAGDDHEGWYTQDKGINIGQYAEMRARNAGRTDLIHLGYMEADVILKAKKGKTIIRPVHPGGGSAYATSYTMQKLVESFSGGEKPHIVLAGHYHKAEYLYYRGVHIIQTGCTQDQTPFMRKKKLSAHVGGWTFEFSTDDNGAVTRFKSEFIPFYDNGYYTQWKHKS